MGVLIALLASGGLTTSGCNDDPPGQSTDAGTADGLLVDSGETDDLALGSDTGGCQALPFAPPATPAGWRHSSTGLLVTSQGPANHRAQDVVVASGAPQRLVGKFAYGPFDKDLDDEDVELFIQRDPPCGVWTSLGKQATSEGQHGTTWGIADDGGRIFFEIPAAEALPVGRYPLRMLVLGDHSQAKLSLTVVAPGTRAVVFDIDGTLTTDDFELITQVFDQLAKGSYKPKAYPAGTQVARTWHDKGYLLVYLTGRPDWLRRITLPWLQDQNAPPGPLHLTDTNGQALPTANGVGTYKTAYLNELKQQGVTLHAAYGNATTDIQAYLAAGVPKERVFIIGKHGGEQGTVALNDYPSHLPTAQAAPTPPTPAPPATFGW
jgi:hypothetical protein